MSVDIFLRLVRPGVLPRRSGAAAPPGLRRQPGPKALLLRRQPAIQFVAAKLAQYARSLVGVRLVELIDKEQPQPGEQEAKTQPTGEPKGGQESQDEGQNRQPAKPTEGETGAGSEASGAEEWGDLPPYLNSLKNRGSTPRVPPKFRKYWEAYLKSKRKDAK